MASGADGSAAVDAYLAGFPEEVRQVLEQVRAAIRAAAPDAQETIKYGLPTFVLHGNLVHYGGFKQHVGFYPVPSGIEAFRAELARYPQGKGSVRFPLDEPMPLDLIARIVRYRVEENARRARERAGRRRAVD